MVDCEAMSEVSRSTLAEKVIGTGAELTGLYLLFRGALTAFTSGFNSALLPLVGGAFLLYQGSEMKKTT